MAPYLPKANEKCKMPNIKLTVFSELVFRPNNTNTLGHEGINVQGELFYFH